MGAAGVRTTGTAANMERKLVRHCGIHRRFPERPCRASKASAVFIIGFLLEM
jgi:hypothetical protein